MPLTNGSSILNKHLARIGANKFNSVRYKPPTELERESLYELITPSANWVDNLVNGSFAYKDAIKNSAQRSGFLSNFESDPKGLGLTLKEIDYDNGTKINPKAYDWITRRANSLGHPISHDIEDFPQYANNSFVEDHNYGIFVTPENRQDEAGIFINDYLLGDSYEKLRIAAHELGHAQAKQTSRYGIGFTSQEGMPPIEQSVSYFQPAAETEAEAIAYGVLSKLYPHRGRGRDLASSVDFINNTIPTSYRLRGDVPAGWNGSEQYILDNRSFLEDKVNEIIPKPRRPFYKMLSHLYPTSQ